MKRSASKDTSKKGAAPEDVDAYLAAAPQEMRDVLEKLRKVIKAAVPEAEEVISYRIPTYKYHGPLVHFVAREKYCSLITVSKSIVKTFKSELEAYDTSGTTIHFTAKKPLPATLIKKIVKMRVEENESGTTK